MIYCNIKYLGITPHNEAFNTGLKAMQTGNHTIRLFVKGVLAREIKKDFMDGETIHIPSTYKGVYNENGHFDFCIIQPNNTLLIDDEFEYFSFDTYINNNYDYGLDNN